MPRKNDPRPGHARSLIRPELMLAASLLVPLSASAQTDAESGDSNAVTLDQISVTAQRGAEGIDVSDVPGSVSIIERDTIERHSTTSSELDALLAKEVPGFSASNEAQTDFGETLRGRDFLVMIDGVPITSPSYAGARSLQNIAPSAIERIEVVRGAVATYGSGATGGIINIITRDVSDETRRWTKIKGSASTTHPDGSGTAGIEQGLSGSIGDTRYSFTASIEEQAGQFDAEGDRIPPNRYSNQGGDEGDRRTVNLQTRLDHALDSERSLDLAFNYYDSEQDSDYIADFSTGNPSTSEKAAAVPRNGMRENEINPVSENLNLALGYRDREFLNQDFRGKVFYKDRESVYGWADWPLYYPGSATEGGNSYLTSETLGARGEFDGEIGSTMVTWGMDASQDETAQLITNGQQSMPPTTTTSVAPFVQLERSVGENWTLSGGVRHEIAEVSVDDYTTVQISPRTVEGGTLDYSETVFNLGAVYDFNPTWSGFAAFSQGFALGNIGRLLGQTTASSVEASDPEAQVVDNYEIGLRATGMTWDGSIAVFESRSDLGTSYTTNNGAIALQRQKERIYGVEADINVDIGSAWRTGGSLAIVEGRYDSDSDGDIDKYLGADRISPPKLDSYVEYRDAAWTHRLSAHYVGDRDRFDDNTAYLQGEVDSYTTFDLASSTRIGDGVLQLAVTNLFNEQYVPALGQAYNFGGVGYVAAPGRRVAASYKMNW
jgi:iron complex outermembrane receptor protein